MLKFAAQVRVVLVGDDAVESAHVAAELAGGHTHLVHRIPVVAAHGRVHRHQTVAVGGQCLQHRRSWGTLFEFLHRRRGGGVGDGIPERRRQFRGAIGNHGPLIDDRAGRCLQNLLRVVGVGRANLHFPFPPAGALTVGEEGPGGDVIVAEFRDGGTVRIVQHGFVALVIHLRDGGE